MAIRQNRTKSGELIPRSWVIDYFPAGRKGKRLRRVINDCSEAEARAIEAQLRRRRDGIKNAVNPQLKNVFPEWFNWVQLHRSKSTQDSITWAWKKLRPHFGDLTVGDITEERITRYQQSRKDTPRACNLEIDWLKSLITWMHKRKLCDPLQVHIERLKYEPPVPKIPTPTELKKWLAEFPTGPKKAVVYIMLRAGLRYAAASHIRWEDIDWPQGVIYYTNKGGKPKAAILPAEARAILEPIRAAILAADKNPTGWIAPNPKTGGPYLSMKKQFSNTSRRSGVPIKGPHTLRHICGTYTLEATDDLRLVQDTLGHTQIRTTQRYTQISLARLKSGQQRQADYTGDLENK